MALAPDELQRVASDLAALSTERLALPRESLDQQHLVEADGIDTAVRASRKAQPTRIELRIKFSSRRGEDERLNLRRSRAVTEVPHGETLPPSHGHRQRLRLASSLGRRPGVLVVVLICAERGPGRDHFGEANVAIGLVGPGSLRRAKHSSAAPSPRGCLTPRATASPAPLLWSDCLGLVGLRRDLEWREGMT